MLKQVQHDGGADLTLDALMPSCNEPNPLQLRASGGGMSRTQCSLVEAERNALFNKVFAARLDSWNKSSPNRTY
jgi:hypothetical protein